MICAKVFHLALLLAYLFDLLFRLCGFGPDTIDLRFRFPFSAESKTSAFGGPLVNEAKHGDGDNDVHQSLSLPQKQSQVIS